MWILCNNAFEKPGWSLFIQQTLHTRIRLRRWGHWPTRGEPGGQRGLPSLPRLPAHCPPSGRAPGAWPWEGGTEGCAHGSRHCLAVEAKPSCVSGPGPPRTGRVNPEDAMRDMRPLGPQVVGGSSVWATGPGCRGPVAAPSLTQRDPLKLAESTFPAPCAPSPTLQTALSWLRPRRPTLLPTPSLCRLPGVRKGPGIRSCLVSVFMHRHQHLGSSRARRAHVGETNPSLQAGPQMGPFRLALPLRAASRFWRERPG